MILFEKEIDRFLSYDREKYRAYFDDDNNNFDRNVIWHAVSLQQAEIKDRKLYQVSDQIVANCINRLERTFKEIVSKLDQELPWVINHDDKDLPWFNEGDSGIERIIDTFKKINVKPFSIGCLILFKKELLYLANDIIAYPYHLNYKNIDVSHGKLPFIIKSTGHLTLDLLSTDTGILSEILSSKKLKNFIKIPYRSRE